MRLSATTRERPLGAARGRPGHELALGRSALNVDLYELTMAESYVAEGLAERAATFQLTCRRLPDGWGYLLAAGLEDALAFLEELRFEAPELDYLRSTGRFGDELLGRLARLRFTGDVRAVPEGTVVLADEPLVEVTAPLVEAQLVETAVLNHIHFQTVIATKAARCVEAASGRGLVDFSLRRTHGLEAGLRVARSSRLAGFDATSNVLAGFVHGIPIAGTMAHSYVESFASEEEAFEAFTRRFPDGSTLLVDTYDSVAGTRRAAGVATRLARRGGAVAAIRLDSGDLLELSLRCRTVLDESGHRDVRIFASGGLDEREIARLLGLGAPIDAFGVGSRLGVSADAPYLDMAYKLVEVGGRPVLKLSTGKLTLPGRKQVWREVDPDGGLQDVLALEGERVAGAGRPLLRRVMAGGARVGRETLEEIRARAARERAGLPPALRGLDAVAAEAELSPGVAATRDRAIAAARARNPS